MENLFSSLYGSLYGKTEEGVYNDLYRKKGSPSTQRMDIRLGQAEDDDEDDDDEMPIAAPFDPSAPSAPAGTAPAKENFFSQEFMGFPNWLIGVFLLGFAYAYRQRKKAEAA